MIIISTLSKCSGKTKVYKCKKPKRFQHLGLHSKKGIVSFGNFRLGAVVPNIRLSPLVSKERTERIKRIHCTPKAQIFCIYLGMKETESPNRRRKGAKVYLVEYTEKYDLTGVKIGTREVYTVRKQEIFTNLKKAVAHVESLRRMIIDLNRVALKKREKYTDLNESKIQIEYPTDYLEPLDYNKVYAEIRQLYQWNSGTRDNRSLMPRMVSDAVLNQRAKKNGTNPFNRYLTGFITPQAIIYTKWLL